MSRRHPSPGPPSSYPHVEAAERYVAGVLDGSILACHWVRRACARHRADLAAGTWRWSPGHAERVCRFVERLHHIKGEWARRPLATRRIVLQPWQAFVLCSLFGWLRPDGTRRYRVAYLELPRKNGKSTIDAAIGLYMLVGDNEEGAEVYCGATTEHQAWEVFGPARMMALRSPGFADHWRVLVGAQHLGIVESAAKLEPVIGSPGDGASPSCAIADEFHEHQTSELWDTMLTGMGARRQPLLIASTTAGTDIAGPCYAQRDHATKVLDGLVEDEELFAVIWTIDAEDDWTDAATWKKANPNHGVSVGADFLEARRREAIARASRQAPILCKHLNVWTRTHTRWLNPLHWDACKRDIDRLRDFAAKPCYVGIDLASKIDVASMAVVFSLPKGFAVFWRRWLPEATVEQPQNEHYRRWRADGLLTVTDGEIIDFDGIEDALQELSTQHQIRCVAYDPFQATQFATRMLGRGFPMVEIPMVVKQLSEPMKLLEAAVVSRELQHNGDAGAAWMASNVVAHRDAKDNIYPRKERDENKIDDIVALLMALNRLMVDPMPTLPGICFG